MPLLSIASVLDCEPNRLAKVVLLCSANRKAPHPAPAWDLYRSEFFRLGKAYAQQYQPSRIFILSAEHGLVPAERELQPYTMTMSALGQGDVKSWGRLVAIQLDEQIDLQRHQVVVLGLGRFADPIVRHLPHSTAPLARMTLEGAMTFLRQQVNRSESDVHRTT